MTPNAQQVLDLVTTTIGAMLYRSPTGWIAIPPGNAGDILTEQIAGSHMRPAWSGGAGPASGGWASYGLIASSASSGAFCCKGTQMDMITAALIKACWARSTNVAARQYCITVYELISATNLEIAAIKGSSSVYTSADSANSDQLMIFGQPIELEAGKSYMLCHRLLNQNANTSSGVAAQSNDLPGWPCAQESKGGHMANLSPDVGDTFSADSNAYAINIVGAITGL